MSTFENKVEVVTDFLRNRASLNRLTDYQEVGRVAAELMYRRGQRRHAQPVRREKIAEVLRQVDKNSLEEKGVLLSSLVVHFWDNEVGHRFHDQAVDLGVADSDTDPGYRKGFHQSQLQKAFDAYPEFVGVDPDTAQVVSVNNGEDEVNVEDLDEAEAEDYEDADA